MTLIIILLLLVLIVGGWWLVTYNGFVKLRNLVEESWKQIDVQLQRRHDLIPNLVNTVKGYAAHEKSTFEAVVAARDAAVTAQGVAAQGEAENMLTGALNKLFALAEAYPDLKASTNFLQLQTELTGTEDRIAAARRIYNANVREYNTRQQTLPANIVAKQMGLTPAEYFEVEDPAKGVPEVTF